MKQVFFFPLLLLLTFASPLMYAQSNNDASFDISNKEWNAVWVSHPQIQRDEYAVLNFGKDFEITKLPESFEICVSADNRYKLYINNQYVGNGPARGDLNNWRYETYDIAQYMVEGKNSLRAIVWNFGKDRPVFQNTSLTEFIIQGKDKSAEILNTDSTYFVKIDQSYQPLSVNLKTYFVVGPGEIFDSKSHDFDWKTKPINDSYERVKEGSRGMPLKAIRAYGQGPEKVLIPRTIHPMEEKHQRFSQIRRATEKIGGDFLNNKTATIKANSNIKILVDQGFLTNAYPSLIFSKGKGSTITLTYAESLFDKNGNKGNRSVTNEKQIIGGKDSIICDGGINRVFSTLWWRTFRYVELSIVTKNEALEINDFSSIFTGYPLKEIAIFKSSNEWTDTIWEVAWRTQRLCAGENFFDCPYYEQLQYVGDTRIQALISRYVSGDTTLMRNAIVSFGDSYQAFGLTQSRYPSAEKQIIPPFSLIWIYMLDDYRKLCLESKLLESYLPNILGITNWFETRRRKDGLLGPLEWWNFADWINTWPNGIPPGANEGGSALISLQYALALQKASLIFEECGQSNIASEFKQRSKSITEAVFNQCYDATRGILADTPSKETYSQQVNAMAILTNTFDAAQATDVFNKILADSSITKASFYFSFYLFEALHQIGFKHGLTSFLQPWEKMISNGLSTFAEKPDPSRSDCHAWSASPIYFYLSGVCGILPSGSGFDTVLIRPNLGDLEFAEGQMPHRKGLIKTFFTKKGDFIAGDILLPQGLSGILEVNGKSIDLQEGLNHF